MSSFQWLTEGCMMCTPVSICVVTFLLEDMLSLIVTPWVDSLRKLEEGPTTL